MTLRDTLLKEFGNRFPLRQKGLPEDTKWIDSIITRTRKETLEEVYQICVKLKGNKTKWDEEISRRDVYASALNDLSHRLQTLKDKEV